MPPSRSLPEAFQKLSRSRRPPAPYPSPSIPSPSRSLARGVSYTRSSISLDEWAGQGSRPVQFQHQHLEGSCSLAGDVTVPVRYFNHCVYPLHVIGTLSVPTPLVPSQPWPPALLSISIQFFSSPVPSRANPHSIITTIHPHPTPTISAHNHPTRPIIPYSLALLLN